MSITIYVRETFCPFCEKAKEFLADRNIPFKLIVLNTPELTTEIKNKAKMNTVPIIYDGTDLIGGFTELELLYGDF